MIKFYLIHQINMQRPQVYVFNTLVELVAIIKKYNGKLEHLQRISDNMYLYLTEK